MFTGIVEALGEVVEIEYLTDSARLTIHSPTITSDASSGDSIAVNGVCLTVVGTSGGTFTADVMKETLDRSALTSLTAGAQVNLERSVRVTDRLGGHLVQGHVDATAEFLALEPLPGGNWWLTVRIPSNVDRYLIPKGSVTLDGVSLTIASLKGEIAGVAIIPHTYENTVMPEYRAGAAINVEVDLIGKYVEKLLASR